MILETYFMIRGGSSGSDWGSKLIIAIIASVVCIYDYKTNEKRLDYFWVYLTSSLIWSGVELLAQLGGTRVFQEKYLFGINVTNSLWLTIPIQGMAEAGAIAILGLFFADRIIDKDTRKRNLILFVILMSFMLLMLRNGINYNNVNAGGKVHSRREFSRFIISFFMLMLIAPGIYWLSTTDSEHRKRGLFMLYVMIIFGAWWNFLSWLSGDRWIEVGVRNSDGSYSNLRRADPLAEFLLLTYDAIIEIAFAYLTFLAIPYLLGLIKIEDSLEE